MRPILALNCLLQIEQERSEEKSSVGDALALAIRCARFCSASLILFASYSPAPLFMRPRHFVRSCAICSHDCWYVEVFKGGFEGVFVSLLLTTMGAFSDLKFSIEDFLWQTFIRHSGNMAILTVPISEEYVHSASLPFSGLLCLESCLAT